MKYLLLLVLFLGLGGCGLRGWMRKEIPYTNGAEAAIFLCILYTMFMCYRPKGKP